MLQLYLPSFDAFRLDVHDESGAEDEVSNSAAEDAHSLLELTEAETYVVCVRGWEAPHPEKFGSDSYRSVLLGETILVYWLQFN